MDYAELDSYFEKYSKQEILKGYINFIDHDYFEKNKRMLLFRMLSNREKNLPREFVDKYIHLVTDTAKDKNEKEHLRWLIFTNVVRSTDLEDEKLLPYMDVIDWGYLSSRKDMTLEFAEHHQGKIRYDKIKVDLGLEFIEKNFSKLDRNNLCHMNLNEELILRCVEEKGSDLFDHRFSKCFDWDFATKHFKKINVREWEALVKYLKPTYKQMMELLPLLEDRCDNEESWNELVSTCLGREKLTLRQKKEIKFFAWI